MGMEELGTLDLSGADLSAGDFTPIPGGAYEVHVHEVTAVEVENETGKLPVGTPGWNIQFRVDGGKFDNRTLFKRYYIPPADYAPEKRKISLGIFANFLIAMGYPQEEVTSGSFSAEPGDWVGKRLKANVKIRPADEERGYDAQNEITSLKPLNVAAQEGSGVL